MNSLPDYLKPLEYVTSPFPREAVAEAVVRREETIPYLLQALDWVVKKPEVVPGDYLLHEYALRLLAQFREPRALGPALRIARHPLVDDVLSDTITSDLGPCLASFSGGNATRIHSLIEGSDADEFAQGAGLVALGSMYRAQFLPRQALSEYLDALFHGRLFPEPGHVWDALVALCTDLRLTEHLESIRTAYAEELADPSYEPLDSVEKRIVSGEKEEDMEAYRLIDDAASRMSWWDCFKHDREEETARFEADVDEILGRPLPPVRPIVVRTGPKIGRNAPCPCGSGKKYKKCCG